MSDYFLVADVGGTNARFALSDVDGQLSHMARLPSADYPTLEAAIRAYLSAQSMAVREAAIAIANPVTGDKVRMTNHHWSFSIAAMQASLGLQQLLVINDFTAQALSILDVQHTQLRTICPAQGDPHAPKAVLGPGTGLGVSGLLRATDGRWLALAGEGGHVSFAPRDEQEWQIYQFAQRQFPEHVSAERLLSGAGLALIDAALADADGEQTTRTAKDIGQAAQRGEVRAQAVFDIFHGLLASVAADVVLTLGARGGVYLCGGILPRYVDWLSNGVFARRFVEKGRFRDYLAAVPVYLLLNDDSAGLNGASRALREDRGHA